MRAGRAAGRRRRWRSVSALAALLSVLCPAGLRALAAGAQGLELTSPVRQQLQMIQEGWSDWARAYSENDGDSAAAVVDELRGTAAALGMSRLPDHAAAAAAYAVSAASEGDFARAGWALEAAAELDPGRPEVDFARARVAHLEGRLGDVLASDLRGYGKLLSLPRERGIWRLDAGLWLLLALLLAGGVFTALEMAVKGEALFYDTARWVSPPLPRAGADLLVLGALLWPLLLPSGLLWLALYWSILLWGYGSASERVVWIVLWLLLGVTPLYLTYQQRQLEVALTPPTRLIENLAAGRLYGAMFSDLAVLRSQLPESSASRELVADLHRRLGQWEHARTIYADLAASAEPDSPRRAAPLNNLGVYHLRKKDYGTAVNYFQGAAEAAPSLPEPFYNLNRAYSELYEFSNAHESMARAKQIDSARVARWTSVAEETPVAVEGGLRRLDELRMEIAASRPSAAEPMTVVGLWRRYLSLSVAAATVLLAITLHLVRRQLGYRSELRELGGRLGERAERWLTLLVPGLAAIQDQRGVRAFAAILLPAALLVLPLVRGVGYRLPLAYDPGGWPQATLAAGGLTLWLLAHLAIGSRRRAR